MSNSVPLENTDFVKKTRRSSLLQTYHDDLVKYHNDGLAPKDIAVAICAKHSLPPGTITGKQVSDRKTYLKKEGRLNSGPDKLKKRARMIANPGDQRKTCKLLLYIRLCTLKLQSIE